MGADEIEGIKWGWAPRARPDCARSAGCRAGQDAEPASRRSGSKDADGTGAAFWMKNRPVRMTSVSGMT